MVHPAAVALKAQKCSRELAAAAAGDPVSEESFLQEGQADASSW